MEFSSNLILADEKCFKTHLLKGEFVIEDKKSIKSLENNWLEVISDKMCNAGEILTFDDFNKDAFKVKQNEFMTDPKYKECRKLKEK